MTSSNAMEILDMEKAHSGSDHVEYSEVAVSAADRAALASIYRKIDARILPFVAIIYLLCYLDRSNIGNAKVLNANTSNDMLHSLDMTEYQYRVALMVFLVAYSLFEAPSNLAMKIFSPPVWLAFLVAAFGSLCAGIGGSKNVATLTALRFLLGAAEAGVFPGMIFYLSFWYGPRERASRIAIFLCSATLAGAFGGAVAYGVGHMNNVGGLEAWRWLFILEGVPCVVLSVAILFFLPKYPTEVEWLTDTEKSILFASFGESISRGEDKLNWKDAKDTLKNVRLWVHYWTYLFLGIGVSSLSLFAPTIVQGLGYEGLEAQLFTIPPYACAYVVTLLISYLSDRLTMRGPVIAVCFTIGFIAFTIPACIATPSLQLRYAMLVIATCSVFGGLPPLCAWVSDNVRNTTAASLASGLNISFTGPGQIIGVWIYQNQQAPRYQTGHAVNAASMFLGVVFSLGLWLSYRRSNGRLAPGEQRWIA